MASEAKQIIEALEMEPHPEGGWFVETWRQATDGTDRASGTAIYFLLQAGKGSHWHRVDSTEIWHYYAGHPLRLDTAADDRGPVDHRILGPDIEAGQRPQLIVEEGHWQSAESLGEFTLVGCTVSPGFEFDGFELAPPGWAPGT